MDNFMTSNMDNVKSEKNETTRKPENLNATAGIVSQALDAMGDWLLQEDLEEPMEEKPTAQNKPNNNAMFLGIAGADLVDQPPANIRKSNFFNFTLRITDFNKRAIPIQSAAFINFCDDEASNGVRYRVDLQLLDSTVWQQTLVVRLVDSFTKEVVKFEGSRRNLDTSRVLLTHRAACMRCSENKTCGNMNETPTDPDIVDSVHLRFYLKCNQNCLRGAGNPKHGRRFQLVVYTSDKLDSAICSSREMFVHNNSKHDKPKFRGLLQPMAREEGGTEPSITAISPCEGWTMGGQTVIIIGEGLTPGIHVMFGSIPVRCQVITRHAVRVQSPPHPRPATVQVYLAQGTRQYCIGRPGTFRYLSPAEPSLDYGFSRLAGLVPRFSGDPSRLPREVVLKRAADTIEQFISMGQILGQQLQVPVSVHLQEQAGTSPKENDDQTDVNKLLAPWPNEEANDVPYIDM